MGWAVMQVRDERKAQGPNDLGVELLEVRVVAGRGIGSQANENELTPPQVNRPG
jgi:hypothetical protein